MGFGEATVQSGNFVAEWEEAAPRWTWGRMSGSAGPLKGSAGLLFSSSGRWPLVWDVYQFDADWEPLWGGFLAIGMGNWKLGWGQGRTGGTFRYLGDLDIGAWKAQGQFAWASWGSVGMFWAEVDGNVNSRVDLFVFTPFRLNGVVKAQAGGTWASWSCPFASWTLGFDAMAAIFRIEEAYVRSIFETLDTDSLQTTTRTTRASLRANPGWAVVGRPRLRWEPRREVRLELSRWIPYAYGWSVSNVEPTGSETPHPSEGDTVEKGRTPWLSELSPWDLWLAGVQLSVRISW
jgi:hypothetical protein